MFTFYAVYLYTEKNRNYFIQKLLVNFTIIYKDMASKLLQNYKMNEMWFIF